MAREVRGFLEGKGKRGAISEGEEGRRRKKVIDGKGSDEN